MEKDDKRINKYKLEIDETYRGITHLINEITLDKERTTDSLQKKLKLLQDELTDTYRGVTQLTNELGLAADALRESEEIFRNFVETSIDLVFRLSKSGHIEYVSPMVEDLFGYNADELIGKHLSTTTPVKEIPRAMKALNLILKGKSLKNFEINQKNKAGRIIPMEVNAAPVYQHEKIIGLQGIMRDISERKQSEEEQKRLISAIDQAAESVVITDPEASILYVNPAFESLTGYTQEEVISQNPRILQSGNQDDAFYKEMWSTLTSGETWRGEIINKSKDGTLFTEEATISPVFDSEGKIINYIGVKHDVTKQRVLEQRLIQAQKMDTVGRLAGGVAHDFNNMLGVILGYTELIMDSIDLHDPMMINLREIQKAAQRSADVTRQLLAFSRKQTIEPRLVNLNPLIAEMGKMLARLLGENIDFSFIPAKDLWVIKVDQGQINQIVANLGINARDAMQDGGKLTIETANIIIDEAYCQENPGFVPGCFVMLAVSDNGIGMDRETLAHVFEPFFTTKDIAKGTGLGLATVYGIVKQHNGFINVYSEPAHGTTFKLYFPRCSGEEKKAEIAAETPSSIESKTILLVEDDEMVRNLTMKILETFGYNVLVAETPNDALVLCENRDIDIDLLLTDVVMPIMSGQELKEKIESIRPGMKTLFMSGYTASIISHHGVLGRGMDFIQKPFTMDELARKVRDVIMQ